MFSEIFILFISREIQKLRRKVRNKARVEGCIVEAELVEEATNNLSLFFRPEARSVRNKVPRYDDVASTFKSSCPRGVYELSADKYEAAFLYVLTNMPEMDDFFKYAHIQSRDPNLFSF